MIKIDNLTKTYNYKKSNAFTALTDVSLAVEDGEMLAIIGKSGAGKSTLLHIIGCIDTFEKGTYTLDDISVHKLSDKKLAQIRNQKVGIVDIRFLLNGVTCAVSDKTHAVIGIRRLHNCF